MKNSFCNISDLKTCTQLLDDYKCKKHKESKPEGELLCFDLDKERLSCLDAYSLKKEVTIYNPTKPILHYGKRYLLGRVEMIDSENSNILFFIEDKGVWKSVKNSPVFDLQDPFYIKNIQGHVVLGGVRVYDAGGGELGYETVFYKYVEHASELINDGDGTLVKPFAVSPKKMKDIRLIELKNGNIGVFTRPQGGEAGLGKIAYIEIASLDELERSIPKARIIENQFYEDEWGGANELHLLKNGQIGVLGHIAHYNGNVRYYYAMSFVFDPIDHIASEMEILTTADEFPKVKSKKSELGKIIFSGGLDRKRDGTASLYVGIGDTNAGRIQIPDPFLKYEFANN